MLNCKGEIDRAGHLFVIKRDARLMFCAVSPQEL
jgi:hypothetical protein